MIFVFTTIFAGIDALACGGDCFENYNGRDYFYSGTNSFTTSLTLLIISLLVFITTFKLSPDKIQSVN